jgi:hypothetical protein
MKQNFINLLMNNPGRDEVTDFHFWAHVAPQVKNVCQNHNFDASMPSLLSLRSDLLNYEPVQTPVPRLDAEQTEIILKSLETISENANEVKRLCFALTNDLLAGRLSTIDMAEVQQLGAQLDCRDQIMAIKSYIDRYK